MKKCLSILLLSALSCFGQVLNPFGDPAFLGAVESAAETPNLNNVTNLVLSGVYYNPLALYMPSASTYTTNTTVALSDSWTNGFNLTNLAASSKWPVRQSAVLNGYDSLLFSVANSTYLQSQSFTSSPNVEIVMVMRWAGPTNNSTRLIFDCASSASYRYFASQNTSGLLALQGLTGKNFYSNTNQWMVWDFVFNNGLISMYTNNVPMRGGELSARNMGGITLGNSYGFIQPSPIEVAYVVVYGGAGDLAPLPGTNITARGLVYSNLASFFNITPPAVVGNMLDGSLGTLNYAAVRVPHQRKSFYAQNRWWVFYSAIRSSAPYDLSYVSSADNGATWSAPTLFTNVANVDAAWSLKYDSVSNKLHVIRIISAVTLPYNGLQYMRGTPASNGSISWDTATWQTVWATGNYIADPSIEVDSSGNPWVACGFKTSASPTTADAAVNKNSATDGTWANASGFPVSVTSSADGRFGVLAPLTNGMALITYRFSSITNVADCYVFTNGDNTFGSEPSITATNVNAAMGTYAGVGRISCASAGGTLWLAYQDSNNVIHAKSRIGSTWSAESDLATGVDSESSPQIAINGSEVVVAWGDSPNSTIRWSYYNGSWSAVQSYYAGSILGDYEHILIPEQCNSTSLLLEWLTEPHETAIKVVPYR